MNLAFPLCPWQLSARHNQYVSTRQFFWSSIYPAMHQGISCTPDAHSWPAESTYLRPLHCAASFGVLMMRYVCLLCGGVCMLLWGLGLDYFPPVDNTI